MEGLNLKDGGNDEGMNIPHIDLGKEPGQNGKANGDTNDSKIYGKSEEKNSEEKEIDEPQELTQENISKLSEGTKNDECDASHSTGLCKIQNDDKKEFR